MSRVGKKPITIPSGVTVELDGTKVIIKKGSSVSEVDTLGNVNVNIENNEVIFQSKSDAKQDRAFWGTYRALINNAIVGLASGFEKKLEINGVGYRAALKGDILELQLGYSHPINFEIPKGIEIVVDKNTILVKGSDKQVVGQVAADIRGFRAPEPYKGKGIKYSNETIIRKAGKTSKK